ncbi:MAG: SHOCT domain-containing protein [SAR324 cluster bacterium]|nr:SHOCT domain-containing protein [SAR324 cluster bacterium]
MKKKATLIQTIGLSFVISALTGCALGNDGTFHYNRNTTIGKELLDLKNAMEKGAITKQEYENLKKEIMKGGPIMGKDSWK